MLIAITGGIGSGKSVVSQLLRVMGHKVYDCDARAKWVMTHDDVLRDELITLFGPDTYVNGQLNKPYLSARIFSNQEALAQMNACVHPAVNRDLQKQYRDYCQQYLRQHGSNADRPPLFFFESAILFDSGFDKLSTPDLVWTVSAPLELRISRTCQRDHTTADKVLARIHAQMPQEEKEKRSDIVIHNDAEHSLIEQVVNSILYTRNW